jgi:hypothetical protein
MTSSSVMSIVAASVVACAAACSGTARGLEAYRSDTSTLLETRSAQIKRCYDDALKTDDKLTGTVTVQFIIEKHTGAIANAAV